MLLFCTYPLQQAVKLLIDSKTDVQVSCAMHNTSLVPRPSLTAFFAAVAKSCEERPGYEASTIPSADVISTQYPVFITILAHSVFDPNMMSLGMRLKILENVTGNETTSIGICFWE